MSVIRHMLFSHVTVILNYEFHYYDKLWSTYYHLLTLLSFHIRGIYCETVMVQDIDLWIRRNGLIDLHLWSVAGMSCKDLLLSALYAENSLLYFTYTFKIMSFAHKKARIPYKICFSGFINI